MRFPWSGYIDRVVAERFEQIAPQIAVKAIEQARPQIERQAGEQAMMELARKMNAQQQQAGYPQPGVAQSPYPLYALDKPMWWATPNSPKRRPDSIADTDTIRRFADTYDVMRSCINHLKREVRAQPLRIAARDASDDSETTKQRIAEATLFFSRQGGLGEPNETRRHYEQKIFEDVLVIGAFASYKNRSKGKQLLQVVPIDASTIRPRMDAYGWPGPGEEWYEQWIMGMKVAGFRPDELVYDGLWPVTHSPWFRSPVEYLISTTLTALKSDEWNRTWLTDGNMPGQMIATPPEWTPEQVIQFSEYFNSLLAGDTRNRQKAQFVPGGMKGMESPSRKDQDFQEFDLWLLRRTCAMFGVQPSSIGFAGEQYKVSQEGSNDQTTQFGAGDLLDLRKEHYDDVLEDLGFGDLEVINGATAEEDPAKRTERLTKAAGGPYLKVNEARQQEGLEAIPEGEILRNGVAAENADEDADASDEEQDVSRWMKKCLRRLRDGKTLAFDFRSDHIPAARSTAIKAALDRCETASQIRTAFES